MSDLFQRIPERKVIQVLIVYLGVGWALEGAISEEGLASSMLSLSQIAKPVFPNLRPLIELGRGEEALEVAEEMEQIQSRIGEGRQRLDPVDYHIARYYQGRAHELLGDSEQAAVAYRFVVDNWGDGVAQITEVGDAAARLRALEGD